MPFMKKFVILLFSSVCIGIGIGFMLGYILVPEEWI